MSTTTDGRLGRRDFLINVLAALAGVLAAPSGFAAMLADMAAGATKGDPGNFRAVYGDPELRDRFFLFLQNVYHLYPEVRFHELIIDLAAKDASDEQAYRALLRRLPALAPTLGSLTYALPALEKQKRELADQTMAFLGNGTAVNGYLEIGSPGRYISELRRRVDVRGPIWLINDAEPSYSAVDLMERGGLAKIGSYVPLGNYDPFVGRIPEGSLDVVTNYIGFHHCPTARLEGFVASIRRVLRPGGRLILRDHDVDRASQWSMVALAHDVFNAGLLMSWEENHAQVRLFRSIADWTSTLTGAGFRRRTARAIAQAHDPTNNLLVEFVKA
jgi:SAM-dependent methyltransferase